MNPEHKRIVELANGWEDSDAVVTLSPGDALLLTSVGAKVTPGRRAADPSTIVGRELYAAAETIQKSYVETPAGAQPTPNQQSVTGPGTDPDPNGTNPPKDGGKVEPVGPVTPVGPIIPPTPPLAPVAPVEFDTLNLSELKELAAAEKVDLGGATTKNQVAAAIKKARAAK